MIRLKIVVEIQRIPDGIEDELNWNVCNSSEETFDIEDLPLDQLLVMFAEAIPKQSVPSFDLIQALKDGKVVGESVL